METCCNIFDFDTIIYSWMAQATQIVDVFFLLKHDMLYVQWVWLIVWFWNWYDKDRSVIDPPVIDT